MGWYNKNMTDYIKDFDGWIVKKKESHFSVSGKTVSAMTSQIRVFSSRRMWNKLAELDKGDYAQVVKEIAKFFILPFLPKQEGRG